MSLLAASLYSKDFSQRRRSATLHTHVPHSYGTTKPSTNEITIQPKPLCPCGGGCPRCVPAIQPKLKVGAPDDIYEREADRVAEQVMRMPQPVVQKQPEEEEEEEELLQTKPVEISPQVQRQTEDEEEEEEEETVQTKQAGLQTPLVRPGLESRINSMKGKGQHLPASTRSFFEPRFGRDFSQVRVHSDSVASETAQALNSRAFTIGQDVIFGQGQYSPGTAEGRNLLAHELVHTVQQKGDRDNPHLESSYKRRGILGQSHIPIQRMGREAFQVQRTEDEEEVFNLVNKKRGESLKWSEKLHDTALGHSRWMHKHKSLVHTKKLRVKGYDLVGENIGTGYSKNSGVVEAWWKSPPHHKNIVDPRFEEAAVGIVGKGAGRYFTQHFGAVDPQADFWKESSKEKGDEWTHIIKGKVSDNIDSPEKLSITIKKLKGDFKHLPKKIVPDPSGSITLTIITIGMETARVRIVTTDSHGNSVKNEISL